MYSLAPVAPFVMQINAEIPVFSVLRVLSEVRVLAKPEGEACVARMSCQIVGRGAFIGTLTVAVMPLVRGLPVMCAIPVQRSPSRPRVPERSEELITPTSNVGSGQGGMANTDQSFVMSETDRFRKGAAMSMPAKAPRSVRRNSGGGRGGAASGSRPSSHKRWQTVRKVAV